MKEEVTWIMETLRKHHITGVDRLQLLVELDICLEREGALEEFIQIGKDASCGK
ncbi:hypothetical protein [Ectobacillus antri]|uniref:hypothetical protein n=1 Tax=Ectobacillus antri TaxID=2486280 RepID=UPI0013DDC215|nr:hypothetical protein [Ectobacillus antri]